MAYWMDWQTVPGYENMQEILYHKKWREKGGGVARIAFNRPHRMNAFTDTGGDEVMKCIRDASHDDSIGVIVITGVGDNFGTGGDVSWEAGADYEEAFENLIFGGPNRAITNALKPIIAAVRGYCIGGHNHLAYFCDLTIAADNAIFGQNGPRVASPAHGHVVGLLANVVGLKRAKEMWMLCRRYTAQEAYQWGLVNAVVPSDQLDAEVDRVCDELLGISPTCLSIVKQTFEYFTAMLMPSSGHTMVNIAPDFWTRPEVQEAQKAFFEKRSPNFWVGKGPKVPEAAS